MSILAGTGGTRQRSFGRLSSLRIGFVWKTKPSQESVELAGQKESCHLEIEFLT